MHAVLHVKAIQSLDYHNFLRVLPKSIVQHGTLEQLTKLLDLGEELGSSKGIWVDECSDAYAIGLSLGLCEAAAFNEVDMVKLLVDYEAPLNNSNMKDWGGLPTQMYELCPECPSYALTVAVAKNLPAMVKLLLESGAAVNQRTRDPSSGPLMAVAEQTGNAEIIAMLQPERFSYEGKLKTEYMPVRTT